jgi:hypothetical protein
MSDFKSRLEAIKSEQAELESKKKEEAERAEQSRLAGELEKISTSYQETISVKEETQEYIDTIPDDPDFAENKLKLQELMNQISAELKNLEIKINELNADISKFENTNQPSLHVDGAEEVQKNLEIVANEHIDNKHDIKQDKAISIESSVENADENGEIIKIISENIANAAKNPDKRDGGIVYIDHNDLNLSAEQQILLGNMKREEPAKFKNLQKIINNAVKDIPGIIRINLHKVIGGSEIDLWEKTTDEIEESSTSLEQSNGSEFQTEQNENKEKERSFSERLIAGEKIYIKPDKFKGGMAIEEDTGSESSEVYELNLGSDGSLDMKPTAQFFPTKAHFDTQGYDKFFETPSGISGQIKVEPAKVEERNGNLRVISKGRIIPS